MADAYDHAWQAEVDRREKGEESRSTAGTLPAVFGAAKATIA
jgi:hypothetical protein